MGALAGETAAILERAAAGEGVEDEVEAAITTAAYLTEKLRITDYHLGWPAVDAEAVSPAEGERLKAALLGLLRRDPNPRLAGRIVWALGKCGDAALAGVVAAELRRGLEHLLAANGLVFNALIALENFGEHRAGTSEQSLTAVEQNIRRAREYLARSGVQVPW
jgi:hypothetical protein